LDFYDIANGTFSEENGALEQSGNYLIFSMLTAAIVHTIPFQAGTPTIRHLRARDSKNKDPGK
jgi:hypothetical protein